MHCFFALFSPPTLPILFYTASAISCAWLQVGVLLIYQWVKDEKVLHRNISYRPACVFERLALSRPASSLKPDGEGCFFRKSLHFIAQGMGYWYSKEQGGLETLTGIPNEKRGCKNCHTECCARCHKTEKMVGDCKRASYSTGRARNPDVCLGCHGREKTMIRVNDKLKQDDVHLAKGMRCLDCHSAREMHGDGNPYKSLKQTRAMDAKCENCHDPVKPTESHTTHQGKLDCKACHIRHVVTCTNCHFDTLVKEGKRKAAPV